MDYYGYFGIYDHNYLHNVTEDEFIKAWIEYINNDDCIDKNFDQDLFENDALDSFGREKIREILLDWRIH
jgi:hypothetical protein